MNCEGFSRWLDEGMHEPDARAADSHAQSCPACARLRDEARSLDLLLAELPATRPATLVDDVMRRVSAEQERTAPLWESPLESDLPWWVRFLAEPAPAASFVLAVVLVAWNGPLLGALRAASSSFAGAIDRAGFLDFLRDQFLANPAPAAALALVAMAAVTIFSIALYRGARWIASA